MAWVGWRMTCPGDAGDVKWYIEHEVLHEVSSKSIMHWLWPISMVQVHEKHCHRLLINSTKLSTEDFTFHHSANIQLIIVKYSSIGKSPFYPSSPWVSGRSVSLCSFYRCGNWGSARLKPYVETRGTSSTLSSGPWSIVPVDSSLGVVAASKSWNPEWPRQLRGWTGSQYCHPVLLCLS